MKFWDSSALVPLLIEQEATKPRPRDATLALQRLDLLLRSWHCIEPAALVLTTARRLLRTHPLRAADSQQLAAAFVAAEGRPSTLGFVCLDDRLAIAAEREGFEVVDRHDLPS